MNKKVIKQLIILIGICVITLLINMFAFKTRDISTKHDVILLDGKWDVIVHGQKYKDVMLEDTPFKTLNRGDVFTIECTLPNKLPDQPVFWMYSIHSAVEIFVDDVCVYEYGKNIYNKNGLLGYGYHMVPISSDAAGKCIKIKQTVSVDNAFTAQNPPVIGDSYYLLHDYLMENANSIVVISFLILFGILLCVITMVYYRKNNDFIQLVWIGMFSIVVGTWSFCNSDYFELFSNNLATKTFLEFGNLYLTPTFLFLYFYREVKKESRTRFIIYKILMALQIMFSALSWGLQISGLVRFPDMLLYCHLLMGSICVFLFSRYAIDMYRGDIHESPLAYGFEFLAVFVCFEIIRYNLQKYSSHFVDKHYVSITYIGVFIFVVAMIIDFCTKYIKGLYEKVENDMLEKLAYTDSLTGLSNRRSLEDLMDAIDKDGSNYAVIEFDLNDLKKVNDNQGHEEGDRYIKEFASALLSVFDTHGLTGRSGGDEFITILPHGKKLDIEPLLQSLEENIQTINAKNEKWSMSVSYGICREGEEGVTDVRKAVKIADGRMYDMKREIKARRM